MESLGFFIGFDLSGNTMTLGLTHPLTEMRTRGVKAASALG